MNLEEERDALRRELTGTQEMLAFVLKAIDAPVVVTKELIDTGLPTNTQIAIDEDLQSECFIFSLVEVEE